MLNKLIVTLFLVLCFSNALAGADYDAKNNMVIISTPLLSNGTDMGRIFIYNERFIKIFGDSIDKSDGKMIGTCGKNPSLSLLFLNGKLNIDRKIPKITEAEFSINEADKVHVGAGWANSLVLKGEDAIDLMDLLYQYEKVGFIIVGKGCEETSIIKSGKLTLEFDTVGLKRAMQRIK